MSDNKSVTVIAFALLGFSIFQFTQIFADRDNIHKMQDQVKKSVEQADKVLADNQKMLDQLNAIAIGTQRLADAGNANAKEIVQQLNRLGIKINPNFKPGQEQAPGAANAPVEGMPSSPPAPPSIPKVEKLPTPPSVPTEQDEKK